MPHTYGFEGERWPKPLSRLDPIKNALKAKGPTNKQPTICQSGNNNQRHLIRCHWLGVPSLSLQRRECAHLRMHFCNFSQRLFQPAFLLPPLENSSSLTNLTGLIENEKLNTKRCSFVRSKERKKGGGTRKESLKAHKRDGQRDTNFKFLEEFLDIWKSLSGKQKCRVVWHFQKIQNKIKSEIKKNMSLHRLSTAFDRLVAIGENLCRFFRRHLGYLSNS